MKVERSFNTARLKEASYEFNGDDFDYEGWLANHRNVMYVYGDDVGLATYEYPGVYNGHWFFKSRGSEALDVAFLMYEDLFDNRGAQAVRGITPVHLRGARYLAKKIGFISMGIEEFPDGPCEIMCLTKDAFNLKKKERNGRHR